MTGGGSAHFLSLSVSSDTLAKYLSGWEAGSSHAVLREKLWNISHQLQGVVLVYGVPGRETFDARSLLIGQHRWCYDIRCQDLVVISS